MRALQYWLSRRVVSETSVIRIVQMSCFLMAPLVMAASFRAVARFASSPFEILMVVLGGSAVALLLVILGLVLPLSVSQTHD